MGQIFRPEFRNTAALRRMAADLAPRLEKTDSMFRAHLRGSFDARQVKALGEITVGAAACLLAAGKPVRSVMEQVDYNGRRLAKLNVPPAAALRALAVYDRMAPANGLSDLRPAIVLALHNAYYRVREEEAQAFFDLFRAELEAADLDDLLERFAVILSRTFRARAAQLFLGRHDTRRRFIEAGEAAEELILDQSWRGHYRSYWSIPSSPRASLPD
jgi:hypothetical protein